MKRIARVALAFLAALAQAAGAQEAAVTSRATALREAPADTARSLASLPAQLPVTRGERRGPWVQVRTAAGAAGWIHMFDLGPAALAATPAAAGGDVVGGALRGVTSLFGNQRPAQATGRAGIRGLDAEDLARAQPNPAAVAQLEGLRQSEGDARAFAAAAALRAVAVEPLPAAARAPASSPNTPASPQSP